ncbi:hypothetical protein AB0K67_07300 [Nonomuraea sp. NPDC052634]|uniref:hypothetical protein n=1 Tax=Nonomuraea sp. NPDC052634 TaxID=3155813 RepID=UPI003439F87A
MTELSDREAELVSAHEQERPARELGGPLKAGVWVVGGVLSAYSLLVVFQPVEAIQHRMTFLAVALPLVFLCYRSGLDLRVRRLLRRPAPKPSERPSPVPSESPESSEHPDPPRSAPSPQSRGSAPSGRAWPTGCSPPRRWPCWSTRCSTWTPSASAARARH